MTRRGPALSTLAFLTIVGCRSAPTPPAPPPLAPPAPATPPPAPRPPPVDPIERYRAGLEAELAEARRLRRVETFEGPIEVRAYRGRRRAAGVLHATFGLDGPDTLATVELLAKAERAAPGVAEVLSALLVRARAARAAGRPWTGYQVIALPTPVRGLQHFDLVPAGEVRIAGVKVDLLRVVPLTLEEYEAASSDAASAWSGAAHAGTDGEAESTRWAPALDHDSNPENPP